MQSQLSPSVWLSTRRDCQTWFCIIRNSCGRQRRPAARRCARRRPAADRLELIVQLVRVVHLEQVGERYGCGPSAAFARSSSNLWQQVWEADGDIYWLSWLIICPARRPGELFGGSGELGEAVPDH